MLKMWEMARRRLVPAECFIPMRLQPAGTSEGNKGGEQILLLSELTSDPVLVR